MKTLINETKKKATGSCHEEKERRKIGEYKFCKNSSKNYNNNVAQRVIVDDHVERVLP